MYHNIDGYAVILDVCSFGWPGNLFIDLVNFDLLIYYFFQAAQVGYFRPNLVDFMLYRLLNLDLLAKIWLIYNLYLGIQWGIISTVIDIHIWLHTIISVLPF